MEKTLVSGLVPAQPLAQSSTLPSREPETEPKHLHRALVHAFPEAGLGVAVAADGVVYQSDVYAASNMHEGSPRRRLRSSWGDRAVLVLIGIRLGIDGVNPIYYEPIKVGGLASLLDLVTQPFRRHSTHFPSLLASPEGVPRLRTTLWALRLIISFTLILTIRVPQCRSVPPRPHPYMTTLPFAAARAHPITYLTGGLRPNHPAYTLIPPTTIVHLRPHRP